MVYLALIGGFFLGSTIGFMIGGLIGARKSEDAFAEGFSRGKLISTNSIN